MVHLASGWALLCCMSEGDIAEHARFYDERARVRADGRMRRYEYGRAANKHLGGSLTEWIKRTVHEIGTSVGPSGCLAQA